MSAEVHSAAPAKRALDEDPDHDAVAAERHAAMKRQANEEEKQMVEASASKVKYVDIHPNDEELRADTSPLPKSTSTLQFSPVCTWPRWCASARCPRASFHSGTVPISSGAPRSSTGPSLAAIGPSTRRVDWWPFRARASTSSPPTPSSGSASSSSSAQPAPSGRTRPSPLLRPTTMWQAWTSTAAVPSHSARLEAWRGSPLDAGPPLRRAPGDAQGRASARLCQLQDPAPAYKGGHPGPRAPNHSHRHHRCAHSALPDKGHASAAAGASPPSAGGHRCRPGGDGGRAAADTQRRRLGCARGPPPHEADGRPGRHDGPWVPRGTRAASGATEAYSVWLQRGASMGPPGPFAGQSAGQHKVLPQLDGLKATSSVSPNAKPLQSRRRASRGTRSRRWSRSGKGWPRPRRLRTSQGRSVWIQTSKRRFPIDEVLREVREAIERSSSPRRATTAHRNV
ncbi:hypothetical protein L7F22_033948 [Adiantum nelumboides]|nr:hypothetical protein [Adiantum nelumboides]